MGIDSKWSFGSGKNFRERGKRKRKRKREFEDVVSSGEVIFASLFAVQVSFGYSWGSRKKPMVRPVKREPGTSGRGEEAREEAAGRESPPHEVAANRRVLRSRYLAVKHLINDEREDISRVDSDKFRSIISEVENLHQHVRKPREQVADAEALLDIANTLVTSVKSQSNEGITPSDFVTALLEGFGPQDGALSTDQASSKVLWGDLGVAASCVFKKTPGFSTMIGPMNTELKLRKAPVQRKRTRPTESTRPKEVVDTGGEERTDTDKNMCTMFDILKRQRRVRLEELVLNRSSFAQTVENIFALSFLLKDGRAEIRLNDDREHYLMKDCVSEGVELMPHRHASSDFQTSAPLKDPETAGPATPIRKLTRNRGLVIQEESVVDDTPEREDAGKSGKRKSKRMLRELGVE
ncbi:hypothetical protein ACLOJK_021218 [Asimina triloba]